MIFEIVLRREAKTDLDEIFVWYEEQRAGLGFDFIKELEATINKIKRNPFYASFIEADAKDASLKKFPMKLFIELIK